MHPRFAKKQTVGDELRVNTQVAEMRSDGEPAWVHQGFAAGEIHLLYQQVGKLVT